MPEVITNNLDLWTSALLTKSTAGRGSNGKLEAYGIKKLRKLILELAVRGKLVPQDPNDEPAEVLYARIQRARDMLIKDGTIKRTSIEPNPTEDECDSLPSGWLWSRLGAVFDVRDGTHDTPKYTDEGFPLITSKNIYTGNLSFESAKFISEKDHRQISERSRVDRGDVLFAMIGSIGNPAIVDTDREFSIKNVALFKYYAASNAEPHFLLLYLNLVAEAMREKSAGGVQSFVSLGFLRDYPFPLPPLYEQHRIVAKVDELMALCDQLEQQQTHSIAAHQTLVASLLGTLTSVESQQEFSAAWARIASHFVTLFTTEASIDQLKQTILQLAVMGKLVPQDPNDEPASVLLERIKEERDGKIKKEKVLPEISANEKLFVLPAHWSWARLGEYAVVLSGNAFSSEDFNNVGGAKVVKITNAGVGEFVETNDFLPFEFVEKHKNFIVEEDDLILALTRPYISDGLKISKCPGSYHKALLNQRVAAIRTSANIDYLYAYMQSHFVLSVYKDRFGSSGLQPNLKVSDVTSLLIPVPPENEQSRIVAKVDELMALCDALKARIKDAQVIQLHLADAIVEQAVC